MKYDVSQARALMKQIIEEYGSEELDSVDSPEERYIENDTRRKNRFKQEVRELSPSRRGDDLKVHLDPNPSPYQGRESEVTLIEETSKICPNPLCRAGIICLTFVLHLTFVYICLHLSYICLPSPLPYSSS